MVLSSAAAFLHDPKREHLRVDMHLRGATAMPRREQHAAAAAFVLDILQAVHHVGDAAETGEAAEAEGPCAGNS